MKEKEIYLLFTHSGSLLSRAIKKVTRDPYSHVSIAFDPELREVYSFGRKKPKNPFIAGFVKEDMNNGTLSLFPNVACELHQMKITTEQHRKLRGEIAYYQRNADRYKYNFLGIITAWGGYPLHRYNAYFCSQFVASVFNDAGIKVIGKNPGLITPMEILSEIKKKGAVLIYRGTVSNFVNKGRKVVKSRIRTAV